MYHRKRKKTISNTDLPIYGMASLYIKYDKTNSKNRGIRFTFYKDTSIHIIDSDGYFTDSSLNENYGQDMTLSGRTSYNVYISNHDCRIIFDKYNLIAIDQYYLNHNSIYDGKINNIIYFDLNQFRYSKLIYINLNSYINVTGNSKKLFKYLTSNLKGLYLSNTSFDCSLSDLNILDNNFVSLHCSNNTTGDLSDINDRIWSQLETFIFQYSKITGDISNLSRANNNNPNFLFQGSISNGMVYGDISVLSHFIQLKHFNIWTEDDNSFKSIYGDAISATMNTSIYYLGLYNVNCSGTITEEWATNHPSLKTLQINGKTNITFENENAKQILIDNGCTIIM